MTENLAQIDDDIYRVPIAPQTIFLETTTHCNLRCKMCAPQQITVRRPDMPDSLYRKIMGDLSNYSEHIYSLNLFMNGEPLMDKRMPLLIRYAKEAGIRTVRIATNGMLLQQDRALALLHSGLDCVIVSVDSMDPDCYASIRIGGNLEQVKQNIEAFIRLREKNGLFRPRVEVRMIEMNENRSEKQRFSEYWNTHADSAIFYPGHNWGGNLPNAALSPAEEPSPICNSPFRQLVILCDGRVVLCCSDVQCLYELGSFQTQSLEQIWHGRAIQNVRDQLRTGKLKSLRLCKDCTDLCRMPFQPVHWEKLLIRNATSEKLDIHLELQEPDGTINRTIARSALPQSFLSWGVPNRQYGLTVVGQAQKRYTAHVTFHPMQAYYDITLDPNSADPI